MQATHSEQEFQVAAQSFVVSPTKMNVLYLLGDMGNPIDVSVPGVSKDKIRVSCNNGVIKKVGGSWEVFPKTTGKAKITVSAEVQGKNRTMGTMEFNENTSALQDVFVRESPSVGKFKGFKMRIIDKNNSLSTLQNKLIGL